MPAPGQQPSCARGRRPAPQTTANATVPEATPAPPDRGDGPQLRTSTIPNPMSPDQLVAVPRPDQIPSTRSVRRTHQCCQRDLDRRLHLDTSSVGPPPVFLTPSALDGLPRRRGAIPRPRGPGRAAGGRPRSRRGAGSWLPDPHARRPRVDRRRSSPRRSTILRSDPTSRSWVPHPSPRRPRSPATKVPRRSRRRR